tara:strand:+ start:1828 stop:1983 length:156 start_codon:yes stop_codon:yes gene_type:complete
MSKYKTNCFKSKEQIKNSLENWDIEFYPVHHETGNNTIKDLDEAIEILKSK